MTDARHIEAFDLERHAAGELGDPERAAVDGHLTNCVTCREALELLQEDMRAFRDEVPYAAFRIEHERRRDSRAPSDTGRRWWLPTAAFSFAAAALLLITVSDLGGPGTEPSTVMNTRIKGSSVALSFDIVDSSPDSARARPGTAGESLSESAVVQLNYEAGENSHVALIGIDGAGAVSLLHPENARLMVPVAHDGRFPFSLTLDATRGVERLFAIFSSGPAPLEPLLEAARQVTADDLDEINRLPIAPSFVQASVWWRKSL